MNVRTWWRRLRSAPAVAPSTVAPRTAATPDDVERFRAAPPLYGQWPDAAALRAAYPDLHSRVRESARRARGHEFNLLGSGPYHPVDSTRPGAPGYTPIDWATDPVSGRRFPNDQPAVGCDLSTIRPPASDIKRPWEQARCYHWLTLAQAFVLDGDPAAAVEIFDQCDDFMEANPVGRGIQWTCTMDVAIRAANWAVALQLVAGADVHPDRWLRAVDALLAHGTFIRGHLENTYEVTSNHFLSNVIGLAVLGRLFSHRPEADEWSAFARSAVEREIEIQVLDDGADFESSIPYHRLVAELFFSALRIHDAAGSPLSERFRTRLRAMHAFMADVLRPDGLMPQVGDADDGRLHVWAGHDLQRPQDARHLFGPASITFQSPEWWGIGAEEAAWHSAWWGFGTGTAGKACVLPPVRKLYPSAGIAVFRDGPRYLLVTNAPVGTRGFGNHKHNDLLSFEFHLAGQPWVVDPGSYVYTSDPAARNAFRSVTAHSCPAPDGLEPNDFNPDWLFRMFPRAIPEHLAFDPAAALYEGRHSGYAEAGLSVTRRFALCRDGLDIVDDTRLDRPDGLDITWRFLLAPGIGVAIAGDAFVLQGGQQSMTLALPSSLRASTEPFWYSPSYGVRIPATRLIARGRCPAGDARWPFRFRLAVPPA